MKMRKQTIVILTAVLLLSLFLVGCSSGGSTYTAPTGPAPTGGGCGVGAPSPLQTDSANKMIASASSIPA